MPKYGHRRRNAGLRQPFRTPVPHELRDAEPRGLATLVPDPVTREALSSWKAAVDDCLFVYFIQAEDGGPVKIGQAANPIARLRELQCGNPAKLVIRAVILATLETEERLHFRWREAAVRGEWFGHGYEDVIVGLATQAQAIQLASHEAGDPLHEITTLGEIAAAAHARSAA